MYHLLLQMQLFKKWLRVTFNLINNELIQSPELFAKAIRGIKELSGNIKIGRAHV